MRVNLYSQELTDEVELIRQKSNTDVTYSAIRWYMHSSSRLHHPPEDDDRSAATIWLPKSPKRREELAATLERAADLIRGAPPEDGLD